MKKSKGKLRKKHLTKLHRKHISQSLIRYHKLLRTKPQYAKKRKQWISRLSKGQKRYQKRKRIEVRLPYVAQHQMERRKRAGYNQHEYYIAIKEDIFFETNIGEIIEKMTSQVQAYWEMYKNGFPVFYAQAFMLLGIQYEGDESIEDQVTSKTIVERVNCDTEDFILIFKEMLVTFFDELLLNYGMYPYIVSLLLEHIKVVFGKPLGLEK